jgi:hypothetical protein
MTENYIITEGNKRKLLDAVTKKDLEKAEIDKIEIPLEKPKEPTPQRAERQILKINKSAFINNGDPIEKMQTLLEQKKEIDEPKYSESKSGKVGTFRISMSPRLPIEKTEFKADINEPTVSRTLEEDIKHKPEKEKTLDEKKDEKPAFNPFTAKDKPLSFSNPFQQQNTSSLFTNNNPNNPFLTKPTGYTFNINFNFAKVTQEEKEESGGEDELNPEEEVEIKPGSKTVPAEQVPKVNPNQFYKCEVETFSVYEFTEKKYLSRGKGALCLQFSEDRKTGFCVFRSPLAILYQGRVIPDTSTLEIKSHNYKYNIVLQKLAQKIGDKVQTSAIKTQLLNQSQADEFKSKWEEFVNSLK